MNQFLVLTLGTHPTAGELRAVIFEGGNEIDRIAREILTQTPLATERKSVGLFRATGFELGLTRRYTFAQLLAAGAKYDLGKLPGEVGPTLRETYTNQPLDEQLHVVMDPIMTSGGISRIFRVENDDSGRWLSTDYVNPTREWGPEAVWVFGRN